MMEIILGYALLVTSFSILLVLLIVLWTGLRSITWPQTDGRLIKAEVHETPGDRYAPLVKYAYEVEGKAFTSTSFDFNLFTSSSKDYVESTLKRFEKSETLTIYYHPWIHRLSVILPGIKNTKHLFLLVLAAVTMLLFSIYEIGKCT